MAARSGHHRKIHIDNLTSRQREVLELVASGKTNIEIAEELDIGFESVKSHVSDILQRLDVTSREEAAAAWRANDGGVFSRLRRSATGFFVTGFGKAAVAGVVALVAVGAGAAIFVGGDGGNPGSNAADPVLDTYLIDDGREVKQALAEAEERYGFPLVVPATNDYRLAAYLHRPRSDAVPPSRSIQTTFYGLPGERKISVQQISAESEDPDGEPVDSGRADIRIVRFETDLLSMYQAYGRGRGFAVNAEKGQPAQDEAVRLILALFDAAPGQPPPSPVAWNVPNPMPTETPLPPIVEILDSVTDGTDFVAAGRDPDDVRKDASKAAGFDIALPSAFPAGMQLVQVRVPLVFASPELRSAYISLHREGAKATAMLVQHNRAIVAPTEDWGLPLETGRPDIEAWRIGDFRDPGTFVQTLMASGNGRTFAIRFFTSELTQDEALAILISTLEAVE